MLVHEKTRLKNQGSHSVHYVIHQGNQGARKRFVKKHDKGNEPLMINDGLVQILN